MINFCYTLVMTHTVLELDVGINFIRVLLNSLQHDLQ